MIKYLPSVLLLILINLIPLGGVLFLGWDVVLIVSIYWLESAVIGFFTILKLRKASAVSTPDELAELRKYRASYSTLGSRTVSVSADTLKGNALIRFFVFHYGAFMLAHGLFLSVAIFALSKSFSYQAPVFMSTASLFSMLLFVVSLMVSHGVSYAVNFIGKQEFLRISPAAQMMQPYRRIGIMHLTVIFGMMFVFVFHSPTPLLVAMVLTKTAVDIWYHLKEHKALEPKNLTLFS